MKNAILILTFLLTSFTSKAQYCTPEYASFSSYYIDNFNLADITNRASGTNDDSYIFYPESEFTTKLTIGKTYPITFTNESTSGTSGYFAAWIDFNEDENFTNDELIFHDDENENFSSGVISIPNNSALAGKKRMRILNAWSNDPLLPCGDYNSGEAEDYIINIVTEDSGKKYYCLPFNKWFDSFNIEDFTFGSISNLNSGSSEFDYTKYSSAAFTGNYSVGESYTIYMSKGSNVGILGGFSAWIDYNDNQWFEEDEMVFSAGPGVTSGSGTILIPEVEFGGKKRMRIRSTWANDSGPCDYDTGAETEDYTINITGALLQVNVTDPQLKKDISVYPNPCQDYLTIKTTEIKNYTYQVYNLSGQVVISGQSKIQEIQTINTKALKSGIYFVQILRGELNEKYKFIKT